MTIYLLWRDDLMETRQLPELVAIFARREDAEREATRLQSDPSNIRPDGRHYYRFDVEEWPLR